MKYKVLFYMQKLIAFESTNIIIIVMFSGCNLVHILSCVQQTNLLLYGFSRGMNVFLMSGTIMRSESMLQFIDLQSQVTEQYGGFLLIFLFCILNTYDISLFVMLRLLPYSNQNKMTRLLVITILSWVLVILPMTVRLATITYSQTILFQQVMSWWK